MCIKKSHREKASSMYKAQKKWYMSNKEKGRATGEQLGGGGVGERKKGPSEAVRAAAAVQHGC